MFESEGVKMHQGRLYGPFRAIVSDNRDPLQLNRIKFKCPNVYGFDGKSIPIESDWAFPMTSLAGLNFGSSVVPPVKDSNGGNVLVWAFFEMGDVNKPLYMGLPYGTTNKVSDVPSVARLKEDGSKRKEPNNFCFVTPSGHKVELDDESTHPKIKLTHKNGSTIELRDTVSRIVHKDGSKVTIDDNIKVTHKSGNELTINASGCTISSSCTINGNCTINGSVTANNIP